MQVLKAEMQADCIVIEEAAAAAEQRFAGAYIGDLEACAYQLARFYNIMEQLALRIARAFENHIDDRNGWHIELVRRMALEIEGVRPFFFPASLVADLKELRSFRHVVRHAYDLTLNREKMAGVVVACLRVADALPQCCTEFAQKVSRQQGWD